MLEKTGIHQGQTPVNAAVLGIFRWIFGALMLFASLRFYAYGWLESLYIQPSFHFHYYGFEWVQVPSLTGVYVLFFLLCLSAFCMMIGLWYRWNASLFFLCFTYLELLDKATYLNHYYLISLLSFWMIFLPCGKVLSVDVWRKAVPAIQKIPLGYVWVLRFHLGLVYVFAGIAKIQGMWLLEAEPLRTWLSAFTYLPVIGQWMDSLWLAYAFSWAGMLYDLSIPFVLMISRTRYIGYAAVIFFHVFTGYLFPIGIFPYAMILLSPVFFSVVWHQRIIRLFPVFSEDKSTEIKNFQIPKLGVYLWGLYVLFQLLFPFRYLAYPGNLFWTEEGYRFSWRVMLMEKSGHISFRLRDPNNGKTWEVWPSEYLTPLQEKMMSTQPDMILEFAHFLQKEYGARGIAPLEVYAESFVNLHGHGSRRFVDPTIDLTKQRDNFTHKSWIIPLEKAPWLVANSGNKHQETY